MVRLSIPLPESTWKALRRVAEERRVTGRASVSTLIAEILQEAVAELGPTAAAD